MKYKAINYSPYLEHFNGNHSSRNGRFTFGDGDNDGVIDDHHSYDTNQVTSPTGGQINGQMVKLAAGVGKGIAGFLFSFTKPGKKLKEFKKVVAYGKKTVEWNKMESVQKFNKIKTEKENAAYQKAADFINRYI